jgi:hypothetical protein
MAADPLDENERKAYPVLLAFVCFAVKLLV